MGIIRVPMQVGNPFTGQAETVTAVVDTGAVDSMMPASLLRRLGIAPTYTRRYRIAGGVAEYQGGSASFAAEGSSCFANVVFGPENTWLMGATTMHQLYLAVDSSHTRLVEVDELPL